VDLFWVHLLYVKLRINTTILIGLKLHKLVLQGELFVVNILRSTLARELLCLNLVQEVAVLS